MAGLERVEHWPDAPGQPEPVDWRKVRLGQVGRRFSDMELPYSDRSEVVALVRAEIAATAAEVRLGDRKPLEPILWSILQIRAECAAVNPVSAGHLTRMAALRCVHVNVDAKQEVLEQLMGEGGFANFDEARESLRVLDHDVTNYPRVWYDAWSDLMDLSNGDPVAYGA